jgi:uncharacterized protein (TIGR03000 family)
MSRLLLGAAAVLLLPTATLAQFPQRPLPPSSPGLAAGTGGMFFRPGPLGMGAGFPTPFYYNRGVIGGYGGLYPYQQFYAPYSSYYGGFVTGGYGYSPYFTVPGPFAYDQPAMEYIPPPSVPQRVVELSDEYPANLTLEFPAAAKVWLDGKEVAGEPGKERVLTSPVLKTGQQYTFKLRAEWEVKGKTYEYTREVTLGPGDKSKLLVMSGTEKK